MFGLKKKLMAATSMLVVSAMMLTTASFAWFTISTNPEISGLTATLVVNENLEIALAGWKYTDSAYSAPSSGALGDAGNYYTYGNLVDLTAIFAADNDEAGFDTTLTPATIYAEDTEVDEVTYDANTFYYPLYDDYGRVGDLDALMVEAIVADTSTYAAPGFGNLYAETEDNNGDEDALDEYDIIYGYYIDYFVKTNVSGGGDLVLTTATDRYTDEDDTTTTGSGTYISYLSETNTEDTDMTALLSNVTLVFVYNDTTEAGDDTYVYAHVATTTADNATTVTAPTISTEVDTDGKYTIKYLIELDEDDDEEVIPITTLAENTDTLIRMYVYLEGSDISNSDIVSVTDVELSLNVQFALDTDSDGDIDADDTLTSMTADMSYVDTSGSES